MNCCNDYGHCTQGQNCAAHTTPAPKPVTVHKRRTCAELGVCQGTTNPCECERLDQIERANGVPLDIWDTLWFYSVVGFTGICSVLTVAGTAGYVYSRWLA